MDNTQQNGFSVANSVKGVYFNLTDFVKFEFK